METLKASDGAIIHYDGVTATVEKPKNPSEDEEAMILEIAGGETVVFDACDAPNVLQYRWFPHRSKNNTYAVREEVRDGKRVVIRMHRQIMKANKTMLVDHINHDGLDNRRCNLRLCSISENNKNKIPHSKLHRFKGLKRNKSGSISAQIMHNGKTHRLGAFNSDIDAAIAYDKAALKYHGEFAFTNFPRSNYSHITATAILSA